jgi:hypothetical protein
MTAAVCLALWLVAFDEYASSESPSSEIIDLIRAENADTISFEETVAFISANGEEIIPSPGTYRVQSVSPTALRLVPFEKNDSFVIKAQTRRHEEDIGGPVALVAIDDDYQVHVLLLLPEQQGLEAIGSSRRGRSRGSADFLTSGQIHEALKRKQAEPP